MAFAGVALLAMVALGAILLPVVSDHYARSQRSYLKAAAEQAAAGLTGVDWQGVAVEQTSGAGASGIRTSAAQTSAELVALSTQVRVRVYAASGSLLVDSGLPGQIDVVDLAGEEYSDAEEDIDEESGEGMMERGNGRGMHGLPNPLGDGLFGNAQSGTGHRSDLTMEASLLSGETAVARLVLSDGPDYGAAVVRTTLVAWLIAGFAAVILAVLAGWLYSRHLTRPILAMAGASNSMAKGDLAVRAQVDRSDEIGTLAESFNAMAEKNQATVTSLRRFVADAAHEIGTPLTALRSDIELARDSDEKTERDRVLDRATTQADRIGRLSGALLSLSLLDTGLPSQMKPLDLAPLVRSAAGSFASRAEQADVDFSVQVPSAPLMVNGYEAGLRGALDNLIDNALKFTSAGGSVEAGVKAENGQAVIWVADTGIGIPPDDLGALFSRFHRGRNAAAYPGSGLGLAIVRATMDLHGGKASVSSSEAGSRFELWLPLV
jgi:signal transduction histidine kinase